MAFTYRLDALLVALMAVLAVITVVDSAVKWVRMLLPGRVVVKPGLETLDAD